MGIEIKAAAPPVGTYRSYPIESTVTLRCDGGTSTLCRGQAAWIGVDYMTVRKLAALDGWLERFTPDRGRIFLCPECRRAAP